MNSDGCYRMVGYDRYVGILGINGLVSKVLEPKHVLKFQPGDVVGLFVFSEGNNNCSLEEEGLVMDTSFAQEQVWYHTFTENTHVSFNEERLCPLPVGVDRKLSSSIKAGPILAIQTGKILQQKFQICYSY